MNLKSSSGYNWSEIKDDYDYDRNWRGKNTKRVWAEILGESYMNIGFEDESSTCCRSVYSNFVLKGFAQERNFWGNFVFTNWMPLIEKEGSWEFEYAYWDTDNDPNDNCLCGYFSSDKSYGYNYFPSYYCTPGHISYCPTPPIDISGYGNGYYSPVSPTGLYSYTTQNHLWWADPFRVYNLDITITVDGHEFLFTD